MKNKVGSNQFKTKRSYWKFYLFIYFTIVFCIIAYNLAVKMNPSPKLISPLAYAAEPSPTPTQYDVINADIKEVFGKYYSKAMLLLKGNGKIGACHENASLNPTAKNINWNKNIPGKIDSIDYGVFQINDKWQEVGNINFLTDPAINIRMAWNIFKHNNYTFDRWTCGVVYGI